MKRRGSYPPIVTASEAFVWFRFPPEVILLAMRWYLRFGLSYRDLEADGYRQVVRECIDAGCNEITVWGAYDGATWLDGFLGRERNAPLLFDLEFEPKPAHTAVIEDLLTSAGLED